jgi:hypothetical protein
MLSGFIAASLLIVVLLISAMLFEIVQDTAVSEFASEQLSQPVHPYQTYCKAESGFCRPVVMLDLTACIPGKFGFDRILTGVLQ